MKRALISCYDKTGLGMFAQGLVDLGYEIVSTGGTYRFIERFGLPVTDITAITGFPECLDGRVKTLDPKIHGGILAVRDNPEHMAQLKTLNTQPIQIVAVNLYPFQETINRENVTFEEAVEQIDIGGPAMLRSAAKNHRYVLAVTDPADYERLLEALKEGAPSEGLRVSLASKVFQHTAFYDGLIAQYFHEKLLSGELPGAENNTNADESPFPIKLALPYEKINNMRYGENPHQSAAFYKNASKALGNMEAEITDIRQIHGKELSFNNINDTNSALALLKEFLEPTAVACKHANPCGVGSGEKISQAYEKAFLADPVSIYGGIIAANRTVDKETAAMMSESFLEIILAPGFTPEALEILQKKKNLRLLVLPRAEKVLNPSDIIKNVSGGLLIQQGNSALLDLDSLRYPTKRRPTPDEMEDLIFTWKIVKHTSSNAIVIGKRKQSAGIGPGQVRRVWACKQAIDHAMENLGPDSLTGAALASDGLFPFPDCAEEAAKAGITAIIQPGGSIRDQDSINLCDEKGIAMVMTGIRHFKH